MRHLCCYATPSACLRPNLACPRAFGRGAERGRAPRSGPEADAHMLMCDRLEATTRERKTAQLIMLEHVIRTIKASFNAKFAEFVKKKGQSLGRVDEKMARLLEIHKELKTSEVVDKVGMADSEQPEQVLVVDDSEIGVEKWVSPAELKAREEEEQRAREAAGSDDTAERALNQMMGGTLAGADAIGVLDKVMRMLTHVASRVESVLLAPLAGPWAMQGPAWTAGSGRWLAG